MQAINQFALNEGISSPDAYALVLRCCPDNGTQGDFSCDRVSQDWCTKFHAAYPHGQNSANMQGTVNPFISYALGFGYTLSYNDAYAILLRCCGDGTNTGDGPCPPANPNSPFYTTDNFCDSDWCTPNSNHPDCRCCDDNNGNTIDLSPWCDDYATAVDTGDFTTMQQIITTIASTFNLNWQQVAELLYDQCLCDDDNIVGTGPCDDFVDNGCCGKCDNANGNPLNGNTGGAPMHPQHSCYDWCNQNQDCCPPNPYGCTDPSANNYNSLATIDDTSCTYDVDGCTDPQGLIFNASINPGQLNTSGGVAGGAAPYTYNWVNNQNPTVVIYTGQDLPLAPSGVYLADGNYTGTVIDANGCTASTMVTVINGCIDPTAQNYNPAANVDDGSCMNNPLPIAGCTDPTATNYNPSANYDDGSCIVAVYGCTDPNALNYYAGAGIDDGSCCFVAGCTDPTQTNYNPQACMEDGSCIPYTYGCTTPGAINYNPSVSFDDGSCIFPNQIGCTDPTATNYSPSATIDDGSCAYGARGGSSSFNGFTNI